MDRKKLLCACIQIKGKHRMKEFCFSFIRKLSGKDCRRNGKSFSCRCFSFNLSFCFQSERLTFVSGQVFIFFYISNCFFSHSTLDTISHHCFGHFVCMTVLVQLDVVSAYLYGCFFYINVIQIMRAREGLTVPILTPLFMMSPCLRFDQFATRMRPARQAVTI